MKRLILGIDEDGGVQVEHDDLSAAELSTLSLIVQDLALKVLKNGPPRHVQINSANDSDSIR